MKKRKIRLEIDNALKELTNYKGIFLSADVISEHVGTDKESIFKFINDEQLDIIDNHNFKNFGTTKLLEYKMVKRVSRALLSASSITSACEEAGVSIRCYMRLRPIIYNVYNYTHENLDESEYYF